MIHPSSIVSKEAVIGEGAVIGPFCVIRGKVRIGPGTILESHVSIGNEFGSTEIGAKNRISAGAVIGGPPQDLKYKGEPTQLIVGDENIIRECVTLNNGTPGGGGITRIGNQNLIMAYSHVAHDCQIQDRVVIANSCQLAGHVEIESDVKIGGVCCVSQFIRLGRHCYIAGDSTINKDIIPFSIAQGKYAVVRATNKIGMDRAGIAKTTIEGIHRAIRSIIKGSDTLEVTMQKIRSENESTPELEHLLKFIELSERGIAR